LPVLLGPLRALREALGEDVDNRWEVARFLQAGALHYIQADPEWRGGVSETLEIGHLCSVHGVKLVPHCHNIHGALHLVASPPAAPSAST
jgi:L-alanine-DL-glutamate epimerase-like enolase superfamily enzyme